MWPEVDERRKEIYGYEFEIRYKNDVVCKDSSTRIKEIVMICAKYDDVTFSVEDVALAVSYNTFLGERVILFSRVANLQFENDGFDWTSTYTSDFEEPIRDDGEHTEEAVLTEMFNKMLEKFK